MAVAGLRAQQKRPAILLGILGATVIRIALGAIALQLLAVIGLLLAGGLLLLWVCWRMFRELRRRVVMRTPRPLEHKTLRQAMTQIILADVSMSLDNVLAVAGAAHGSTWVLAVGLLLSVVLMGVAANLLAQHARAAALDRLGRPADRALYRGGYDLASARTKWPAPSTPDRADLDRLGGRAGTHGKATARGPNFATNSGPPAHVETSFDKSCTIRSRGSEHHAEPETNTDRRGRRDATEHAEECLDETRGIRRDHRSEH